MSCGFSPMLEQMVGGKKQVQQTVVQAEQNVAQVKSNMTQVEDNEQDHTGYDWTKTYEKWDAWKDPEELATQEQKARDQSERAAKAPMGCNHDHSAEKKLMEMTTEAKLAACDEFRVLGNLFFKHGQYQRAAFHYHKALVYFEYVFPDTDDEQARADILKLKLLLNFAACRLKTMHLDDAVHHANQALEIDQDNVKALYRRAQAYRLQDKFDLAQEDITHAIDLSKAAENTLSADSLLMREKKLLQAKILAYKLRTKQVSSAMFGNGDKMKAPERLTSEGAPEFRDPDASAMTLSMLKISDSAPTSSLDDFERMKPSTRGLKELQTLIASLDC